MNARRWFVVAAIPFAAAALAQHPSGNGYEMVQSVIAAGGGSSSGANARVTGTLGQSEAEPLQPSTGAGFEVTGGFWHASIAPPVTDRIFADDFE
jgi:hypothetical protein